MLELLFDVLIWTIPLATGRAVLYVCTLGRATCDDGVAEVIGIVFWLAMFIAASVLLARW